MQNNTDRYPLSTDCLRFGSPFLAALFLVASASAQDSRREHAAHQHGSGALNVAVQAGELAIELRMPGVNVVGFEHAPASEADHAAIDRALAVFRDPARLFVTDAKADCVVEHAEASIGPPGAEHGGNDGHGGDNKSTGGDSHAETEPQSHAELRAEYHFQCASPRHLKSLEVMAFEHLLDVDELDAQVVTDTWQGAVELTPGRAVLPLGDS